MVGNQKVCIKLNEIGSSQKTILELQILNYPECVKKKRGEKVAKLAMFTQRDFALIQACELDRAQNKRKQMCPSHQQIYYY